MRWTKPIGGLAVLVTAIAAVGAPAAFLLAAPGTAALTTAVVVVAIVVGWTALGGPGGDTPYW